MVSICCTVTNDLTYDQRMNRICTSLAEAGYDVTLVGRKRGFSKPLRDKPFRQKRLRCFFNKGPFFYAEYNIRLFFFLLTNRFDIISGIDLDTILPTQLVARLRGKPFVYDAHEFFTEMEEIVARPLIFKVWKWIERSTVPKAKYGYTVSEGYASLFRKQYGVDLEIVRNATVLRDPAEPRSDGPYILYQGAVNVGRAMHELLQAMRQVDCPLYICGKGDVYEELQVLARELKLEEKVKFWGYVEPEELRSFTSGAHIGLTLFSNAGLSNTHSLANRFFDYLHNGVPQLAMAYPEYESVNAEFELAHLIPDVKPESIAAGLNALLSDPEKHARLKANCFKAREVYNWQAEEKRLLGVYTKICSDFNLYR